jgi:adenosylhomocysteine nucleosidase
MNQGKNYNKRKVDIGILTIVTEEQQAVLSEFNIPPESYSEIESRCFYERDYSFNEGLTKRLVVLQSADQGNLSIINAYHAMIKNYELDYIVLLGIAGSIQKKINLCDVIIGTDIIYYEKKKEGIQGFIERRGTAFNNSIKMNVILNRFFSKYSEPAILGSAEGSYSNTFQFHRGPIGSGETIVADPLSETKRWLLSFNSKTTVVETESAGFYSAWRETKFLTDLTIKETIILRGISDHADFEKDDNWRLPASKNAVIVLKKLIEFLFN